MFIVSNRNIILPGPQGEKFFMRKGFMGPVPAWAEDSAYLKALEADGKVVVSAGSGDKDVEAAGKKKGKGAAQDQARDAAAPPAQEPEAADQGAPEGGDA